jgi:tetratricopeptide (TPR) repeat protein
VALRNKGDTATAAALAEKSLGDMRRVLGTDHDVTLLVTAVIATAAVESGNAVDGGRLAREVLATIGDAGGSKQPIRLLATAALAHAAESQGRYPEAAQAYGKLVELDPNNPTYLNNFGVVLFKTGNRQEAIRQFRRALELKPDFQQARDGLAIASKAASD